MPKKPIFLSHAVADKKLVSLFENLLARSTGLGAEDIFCTSLEGQGVKKGTNFVSQIRDNLRNSGVVVALISPEYMKSPFCMAELGAAWALRSKRLPFLVPPASFDSMTATLLGIVGTKIDDRTAVAQALGELRELLDLQSPPHGSLDRYMNEFQEAWRLESASSLLPPGHGSSSRPRLVPDMQGSHVTTPPSKTVELKTAESERWSERKREVLFEIYNLLQKSALPAYDQWCDLAYTGHDILIEQGKNAYMEHVRQFLSLNEFGVGDLARLIQANGIYPDLVSEFSGGPEASALPLDAQRKYMEKVRLLPEQPNREVLGLLKAEYESLQKAVGSFGEWIRGRIKRAEELAATF
ncbi:toll/interleukin-1 receptor domain-containing protein [Rhizobium bangladeshense]|uniref:toll/interleukin-1 receptor domain-containing protein n=1 Tax=Rhizobium bangladeshense TaxID=1138189 RepID=UPI001C83F891|nr:toll/interleukin-1 receptor domain-containing protein [Rhizobium bangladeshense]MBX4889749.1 toll/interleukin-1 receptor domain-containing protein [Rhizobium bangladeshense]